LFFLDQEKRCILEFQTIEKVSLTLIAVYFIICRNGRYILLFYKVVKIKNDIK
jgi:hypothetical protein